MELTDDENTEKYNEQCLNCTPNTLLPYHYERTCISRGHNFINRNGELTKNQRKKTNFNNRLKYAEIKRTSV